jgi:hypothetical protein
MTVQSSVATAHVGNPPVGTNWDDSLTSGVIVGNYTVGGILVTQNLGTNNPENVAPTYTVLAYYDVYCSTTFTGAVLKFYTPGLTTGSQILVFSALAGQWVVAPSVAGTGGIVVSGDGKYISITFNGDLNGTVFAVVNTGLGAALPSFGLLTPASSNVGSIATTPLTNIAFTWNSAAAAPLFANNYEFVLSANSDLSNPIIDAKVNNTAYNYTGADLTAGTSYFWQVTALNGNTPVAQSVVGAFMASSAGAGGQTTVTVTPTTYTTTTIIIPTPVTTIVTNTLPAPTTITTNVTVTTIPITTVTTNVTTVTSPVTIVPPATKTITPTWIWGIIGVGAILVIVVIVLIVRTRRSV